ncbi:MAG TPA: acyl-CoA thioesterase, partial [bacterium]|nr:acyl-CoA thioesterase [bacterium]
AEAGISLTGLQAAGQWFVVARQETDHHAPARYGEQLTVMVHLTKMTRVKLVVASRIVNQAGVPLVDAVTTMACVGRDFAPQPLAAAVRRALAPWLDGEKNR